MTPISAPEKDTVDLHCRVSRHDRERFRAVAALEHRTINGQLRKLVLDFLEAHQEVDVEETDGRAA